MDLIGLIFPSLYDQLSDNFQEENYFHIELDVLFKFLTKPYENVSNEVTENSTNFSRAKKFLDKIDLFKTKNDERKRPNVAVNLALTNFTFDKLLQRSEELIKIIDLTHTFTLNQTQNPLNKTLNSKMSRKSYASSVNCVLDFDSVYLILLEDFFLNIKILSYVEANKFFISLQEKISKLKKQTTHLLQLVGVHLQARLNNNFDGTNTRLIVSVCNHILSEMTLNSYFCFSLDKSSWKLFSEIMIETNLIEICWDICSFQQQNLIANETILYENTQSVDDYEIDQENLNS